MEIFLIRHAQTASNRTGCVQGLSDSPLTEEGRESTRLKAEKIKDFAFDASYCSDLPRAAETFRLLKKEIPTLPTASLHRRLRDIDFGLLTGRPQREILEIILKHKANPHLEYPGGESGSLFEERVCRIFLEILRRHSGERVLVVSHYGVMETAAHRFAGIPDAERVSIAPDDVWVLNFVGGSKASMKIL